MNTISFMTANYVARPIGYTMTEGWMQGQNATIAHFQPIETYAERLGAYFADIQAMGFSAIDLWIPLCDAAWASEEHIAIAEKLIAEHDFTVVSLAGYFGDTVAEFARYCAFAARLGIPVLGGMTGALAADRAGVVAALKEHGVKLGIENHPEKTPEEVLAKIGDGGGGTIGTALDTGWYGTQGYDAAKATEILREHIVHMHLKDVKAAGAHETCRFGEGVVPIRACVDVLKRTGYDDPICVEHEPETFDPTEDAQASLNMLKEWLQ